MEEEPTLEHESVTMLKGAAKAPAPAEDAAVEGSTGVSLTAYFFLNSLCTRIDWAAIALHGDNLQALLC